MVKVTFTPWEEIVIHEVVKFNTLDEFVFEKISGLPKGAIIEPLVWAEGIIFTKNGLPPTSDVIREQLKGIIHYSVVEYAPMEDYADKIVTPEGVAIKIINATKTTALRDVALAVKAYQNDKSSK